MAIVKEFNKPRNDGGKLYKTYSDSNNMIKKVGTDEIYEEAIDVKNAPFEYEETTELIVTNEVEEKAMAYDILVGEVE